MYQFWHDEVHGGGGGRERRDNFGSAIRGLPIGGKKVEKTSCSSSYPFKVRHAKDKEKRKEKCKKKLAP